MHVCIFLFNAHRILDQTVNETVLVIVALISWSVTPLALKKQREEEVISSTNTPYILKWVKVHIS